MRGKKEILCQTFNFLPNEKMDMPAETLSIHSSCVCEKYNSIKLLKCVVLYAYTLIIDLRTDKEINPCVVNKLR